MNDNIKQFDKLISYAESSLPAKNIKLIILGDGLNREKLLQQVKRMV
jgi:hypothetical protein